jgi:alanine dehydrogenase
MHIGIPREVKPLEGRIALVPEACAHLVAAGHRISVERGAGELSSFSDEQYRAAGAGIAADARELFDSAELIVKVKEPQPQELELLKPDHLLFCYLHLAASEALTRGLQTIGLTAIGFETVQEADGTLPLLAPMSDIAGRISAQAGMNLLYRPQGGKGLLLGGTPAAERGRAVIIGAGTVGSNAAAMLAAIGAEVVVFDRKRARLVDMRALGNNVTALYPYTDALQREIARADLVIGAVLQTGGRAPHIVSRDSVRSMQPGSVVIDVSVDQGGCIETTRPTDWREPTYIEEGVVHFAVTNMPGAVPRTASQALSAALLPFVQTLTRRDWKSARPLARGVNIEAGQIIHPALQETFA